MSERRTNLMGMLLLISILSFSLPFAAVGDEYEGLEAEFTVLPHYPHVDETVTFDASESTGDIVSYEWDFGDGTPKVVETGPVTTHAYTEVEEYDITLNVTDSEGSWDIELDDIEVIIEFPEAEFTFWPDHPSVDQTVTFDASESTGDIVSYEWDFGDGTPKVVETGPVTTHAYTEVEEYDITLNVTDSEGSWDIEDEDVEVELKYKVALIVKSIVADQTLFERTFKGWEEDAEMEIPTPLYDAMVAQFGTDVFTTPFSVIICETLNFTATSEPAGLTITYKPEDDGDVIDDDIVDIFDLIAVGVTFGSTIGAPDYDLLADLDFDYDIDVFDLIIIGVSFGDTYDCFTVTVEGIVALDIEIPEQEEPYTITIPPAEFTAALPNWINPGIYPATFEGEATISATEIWFIGEIKIKDYEYWALFKVANTYPELPLVTVDAEGALTTTAIAK
ncbi:MAG: PKD domain-containing protein [Candidatus Bathyarchaeota archaeon]|nr:PKD domain-containing protein [Candidatus Bathyarchaeota archaeon]MDH5595381.1 PKD domain-containing protein [Candidatus Bathyarchaeota archaeon]